MWVWTLGSSPDARHLQRGVPGPSSVFYNHLGSKSRTAGSCFPEDIWNFSVISNFNLKDLHLQILIPPQLPLVFRRLHKYQIVSGGKSKTILRKPFSVHGLYFIAPDESDCLYLRRGAEHDSLFFSGAELHYTAWQFESKCDLKAKK